MTAVQNRILETGHAAIAISACLVMIVVSFPARATTGNPFGKDARAHQICERILHVAPGEAAFAECTNSLSGALQASGQPIALQPIRVAGSEEDDGLPYYANSASLRFYRDQQACTQLGLTARAETNCVMNLAAAMEDLEFPMD